MCEIMENYLKEGLKVGIKEERIKAIQKLIKKDCTKEFILDLDYTEEEYKEAEKGLMSFV